MYLNQVTLAGNVTRDPEIVSLPKGGIIAKIGLAMTRKYTLQGGEKQEETTFVDISFFGKTAEIVEKYVRKGDPLLVGGRLRLETWEKDGKKNSKVTVVGEMMQLLKPAPSNGNGESKPAPARATVPAGEQDFSPSDSPF